MMFLSALSAARLIFTLHRDKYTRILGRNPFFSAWGNSIGQGSCQSAGQQARKRHCDWTAFFIGQMSERTSHVFLFTDSTSEMRTNSETREFLSMQILIKAANCSSRLQDADFVKLSFGQVHTVLSWSGPGTCRIFAPIKYGGNNPGLALKSKQTCLASALNAS